MATFDELKTALGSTDLHSKVGIALRIIADKVHRGADTGGGFDPSLHSDRLVWSKALLLNVENLSDAALSHLQLMVAAARAESLEDILALSDADVQTAVEEGVDLFAKQGAPGP